MPRTANVYIDSRSALSPGVRTLFHINGIECREIDVTDDPVKLDGLGDAERRLGLPLVELEGRFAAGSNIQQIARALGLKLHSGQPVDPKACC